MITKTRCSTVHMYEIGETLVSAEIIYAKVSKTRALMTGTIYTAMGQWIVFVQW